MKPKVLILHASGINRDHEAAWAAELAGGAPEIVHINELRAGEKKLDDYQMMIIAGGFSYGDALGAGKRLALDLKLDLEQELQAFVAAKKPIIGICNGFQALAKAGLLDNPQGDTASTYTLTHNAHGRFECRWVTLLPNPDSPSVFTRGLSEPIYCPVAHGEGQFVSSADVPESLVALRYAGEGDAPAGGLYPFNPNRSVNDIAGITSESGTIMGLMPHPEDHIVPWQHPRWTRGEAGRLGLPLFEAGVKYAAELG